MVKQKALSNLFVLARFQVGQNLAIQFSRTPLFAPDWSATVNRWYDEVVNMTAANFNGST